MFLHFLGLLLKRAASDIVLCDKAFDIAWNPIIDDYQRGLASFGLQMFCLETWGKVNGAGAISNITPNKWLSDQLLLPTIRNPKICKATAFYIDNIWVLNLRKYM